MADWHGSAVFHSFHKGNISVIQKMEHFRVGAFRFVREFDGAAEDNTQWSLQYRRWYRKAVSSSCNLYSAMSEPFPFYMKLSLISAIVGDKHFGFSKLQTFAHVAKTYVLQGKHLSSDMQQA